jgi:hypothetical protein
MLKSLLYASVSTLAADDADAEIERIVAVSRERNADLGVTGTLIFNRERFAQIVEGPAESVDAVMARILRDRRHERVTVVDVIDTARRMFDAWSLSYRGASYYVDKHIGPLLEHKDPTAARQLRQLMHALARSD